MIFPLPRIVWPFSRRSDRRNGGDLESWEVGDIAECVYDGPWFSAKNGNVFLDGPRKGHRIAVRSVEPGRFFPDHLMLFFADWPNYGWHSGSFRKVRPCADEHTAADAAFTEQLHAQPKRLPAAPPRELEEAALGPAVQPARCAS